MNVYLSYPLFERLILDREDSDLKLILQKLSSYIDKESSIFLDIGQEQIDESFKNPYNSISIFVQGYGKRVNPGREIILSIIDNPQNVLLDPSALYVLDIDVKLAACIQEQYGVFCCSSQSINVDYLTKNHKRFTSIKKKKGNWTTLFHGLKTFPLNSIVISDRYLFADDIGKRESNGEWHFSLGTGYENLLSFLGHVLPGELKSEFMIFLFYNAKEFSGNTHLNQKELEYAGRRHFKKIANSLNKEIKNLRKDGEYPIVVEALSFDCDSYGWEETHNRRVYSNYGELFAEHKLNAFSNNICQFTQNIYYNTLYSEGLHDESSCPAESHDWALAVFSDIIRFFKETEKANYFYAQNGNDKSNIAGIKNRLLIY